MPRIATSNYSESDMDDSPRCLKPLFNSPAKLRNQSTDSKKKMFELSRNNAAYHSRNNSAYQSSEGEFTKEIVNEITKPFDLKKVKIIIKKGETALEEVLLDRQWTLHNIPHFAPVISGVN